MAVTILNHYIITATVWTFFGVPYVLPLQYACVWLSHCSHSGVHVAALQRLGRPATLPLPLHALQVGSRPLPWRSALFSCLRANAVLASEVQGAAQPANSA